MLKSAPQVKYRPLREDMISEFRALHKDLLPVQYGDKFYSDVLHAKGHVAYVASIIVSDDNSTEEASSLANEGSSSLGGSPAKGGEVGKSYEKIVGVASGRICIVTGMWRERRDGYIMTLGTHEGYRGLGIASRLLDMLMETLASRFHARSFSLHCTVNNTAAISLYTRKKFCVARELPAHYHFHGEYHDAYELILEASADRYCTCILM